MLTIEELVRAAYAALAGGDRDALDRVLDPDFEGTLADSLPFGIGGVHRGADAMIEDGWWAIGASFDMRAEPAEWIATTDGRILVLGRYVGRARPTGNEVDAAFAHLWTARAGRLSAVWQLTDSARWLKALGDSVPADVP